MATWGDLNGPTNIFQRMTQPPSATTPPPAKVPGYERFGSPTNYRTTLQDRTGGVAGQNMGTTRDSPLGDLGMYLTSNPFRSWKLGDGGFDEAGFMSYNQFNGIPLYRKNEQGGWEINPEGRLAELNKQFSGLDFRLENDPYVEDYDNGRPSFQLKWNPEALPKDRFGNYGTSVNPDFAQNGLFNDRAVYDDPFYGRITPQQNLKPDTGFMDNLGRMITRTPLLLSLVTMGLGGALGGAGLLAGGFNPSTILSLGQGAGGAMNGDFGRLLQAIVSAGLPMTGLSGMPLNLARMGSGFFTNMLNNNGRGGG